MLSVLRPSLDAINSERITEIIINAHRKESLTVNRSLCDSRQDHTGLSDFSWFCDRVRVIHEKGKWGYNQG